MSKWGHTQQQDRERMQKVLGRDTSPELIVRRLVHSLGYRYRLHRVDLPGRPDIVFPGRRKIIFVNGCFWHRHRCKRGRSMPATNVGLWQAKFRRTVQRDRQTRRQLQKAGWAVLVLWECQTRDLDRLARRIHRFLG